VLGASAICEYSIADQGILHAGVSEQTAISSKASVGVGIMSGVANISFNNTQTSNGIYITGSTNAELSFNNTQTSNAVEVKGLILNTETLDIETAFTKTSNSIMIGSGIASKDLNMTQSSTGDILFVDIDTTANTESYSTITPSGTESSSQLTPSSTDSWVEITAR
tara:strand:- start:710 stop:1207 length:498 start_codon:yes stop_codon:yes gene_type:complete